MPTYDYQCEACGKVIEVFHGMSESGPEFCDCEKKGRLHRLVSGGAGLIFKGSGFYITDYGRKNGGNGSGAESSPSSSSSSAKSEGASSDASGSESASSAKSSSGESSASKETSSAKSD